MPSELDRAIDSIIDRLTAPGAPFATHAVEHHGATVPAFVNAPLTLAAYFDHYARQHAKATMLVCGPVRLTYAEAHDAARALAGGLVHGYGIGKGDRVGIAARNSANWIVAYMAVLMAGGCAVLLNGFWEGEELAQGVEQVGCKLVLADDRRAQRLSEHCVACDAEVLVFAHAVPPLEGLSALLARGGGSDTPLPVLAGDDLATILFTSGSTGRSKGAWSDHRAVVQATMAYAAGSVMLKTLVEDAGGSMGPHQPATLINVPLFHVTGEVPVFLQSFALGRKLVLMPKWDAEQAMRLIEREKVTYFTGVPLMSLEIATHPDRADYDLSSCTIMAAGGAPRPVEHVRRLRETMPGAPPALGYGLTETNAVGSHNIGDNYAAKPDSTGRASRPLVDVAILDDAGHQLPQGERGEVCLRSVCNVGGYWNDPAATQAAFTTEGWFRSGDIGFLDPDGYLFIVDRKKDIIIRGGENISCVEVEAAIYAHPDVSEASVFGLADTRFGEVPGAVFVVRDDADLTPEMLRDFLAGHIAPFKIPERLWLSNTPLPRLGTEKIDKPMLRKLYGSAPAGA